MGKSSSVSHAQLLSIGGDARDLGRSISEVLCVYMYVHLLLLVQVLQEELLLLLVLVVVL